MAGGETTRTPEQNARRDIDADLEAAGWLVQNRDDLDLTAGLPDNLPAHHRPLPFLFESNGSVTYFTNGLDPVPRSRQVFNFPRPETLAEWAAQPEQLRARLKEPPPLDESGLWSVQFRAIRNLEESFGRGDPRSLIQMATGSGKTFTAVNVAYRLLKFAGAKRILFLVDRSNLGRQTEDEFANFEPPDDPRKFPELYTVQRLLQGHEDDDRGRWDRDRSDGMGEDF